MRWTAYSGDRIPSAGRRTFVEIAASTRFAEPKRIYGYVWQDGTCYSAYFERLAPGEVIDVELGKFDTDREARFAVETALNAVG